MKCWQVSYVSKGSPSYVGIGDPDTAEHRRELWIEDSEGRTVVLRGEEIGQLYRAIKPALAG